MQSNNYRFSFAAIWRCRKPRGVAFLPQRVPPNPLCYGGEQNTGGAQQLSPIYYTSQITFPGKKVMSSMCFWGR
ncbi:hypothetical protein E2C01_030706 [Portunus trituberculatus]|uniref:Uncharacterized protein n=1 Tax=Portunus trituberculatus TaxID=210409 RepID=A0A5B7ESN3_PORTR|nr:hypothetical protein [Portunus trituberculatus]